MIRWHCPDPMPLWEWLEANCPGTRISAMAYDVRRGGLIDLEFGSNDEEILFKLRWTMPGSGTQD